MRPLDTPTHANIGTALAETRFRLDDASTAHIVGLLTNQYSDPLLAALRELATNAADSHITARNNAPIRVTLPTVVTSDLVVEDFGLGLSVDDLRGIYSAYGASSKREDDEVNGTLGIGSKAPLAYTDVFSIRSRKDGIEVLAVVAKDEDGVPVLREMVTSDTEAANGVRISVPIRQRDFASLQVKADTLFQYWEKGTVLVNGQEPRSIRDDESLIWLDDDVAVATNRHESTIVQHGVPYPIDYYRIRGIEFSVIAFVPTGTVKFAPSREALEYNERTTLAIDTLQEYAKERFEVVIRQRVEAAATTYERLVLVQQWRRFVPKVANDFFGKFGLKVTLGGCGWGWRLRQGKASKVEHIGPHDLIGEWPIITGYPLKSLSPKNRAKIARYFEGQGHKEYLFLPPGTSLTAAIGRDEVHAWSVIDAATPDVKVPREHAYKGQTEYVVYVEGDRCIYTLKEAKEAIAEAEITTVTYTIGTGSSFAGYLPDAAIFCLGTRQVDKIVRETGAVDAWAVIDERRQAARKALTAEDIFKAKFSTSNYPLAAFAKESERIQDPDVRKVLEVLGSDSSGRVAAFENLGGDIWNLRIADDDPTLILAGVTTERYPLLNRYTNLHRTDEYEDALIYINAKHQQISASADGPITSPNPAKEQS